MSDAIPPREYRACRARFLAAAHGAGLVTESHVNAAVPGLHGEELACDVARVGPREARKTVFVMSGVHGLEGPAGSHVQAEWLESGAWHGLPEGLAVVLIHAINPYGFSHRRRNDEHNVDPNRNFVPAGERPRIENPGYRELHPRLCPSAWSARTLPEMQAAIDAYNVEHGWAALVHAVSGGQTEFPQGLFYCGREMGWSMLTLRDILARHAGRASNVGFVDFHTGLGLFAQASILCFHTDGSAARRRAAAWFGAQRIDPPQRDPAREDYHGLIYEGVDHWLRGKEATIVCVEFGTREPQAIVAALVMEHWLHFHADKSEGEGAAMLARVVEAFTPASREWWDGVAKQGLRIVSEGIAGLSSGAVT
jgi:prepilin-type processing-associated H-X9-DG protein